MKTNFGLFESLINTGFTELYWTLNHNISQKSFDCSVWSLITDQTAPQCDLTPHFFGNFYFETKTEYYTACHFT